MKTDIIKPIKYDKKAKHCEEMTRNVITTKHELYLNLKFKNHSLENHKQYLKRSWRKLLDWHITVHPPDLNNHFKHNIILIF